MLKILRRIVQEVNTAQSFEKALQILVNRVREAMDTHACTVFLVDKQRKEYVLLATDGLNPHSVGKIRLKFDEGLVGLVGRREELINIDNAPAHPNFFYSLEVGEERFKAFLGVPIIHNRHLLGILVVQQEQQRCFDETEEAFLVTMAAQLGGVLAHAEATGEALRLLHHAAAIPEQDIIFHGTSSAPGIETGEAVIVYPLANLDVVPYRKTKNIKAEKVALRKALVETRKDIQRLKKRVAKTLPEEEQMLFEAYLHILGKASLEREILEEIDTGQWVQGALRKVITRHINQFEAMDDDYLRERVADLRDLGRRVLMHLQSEEKTKPNYPKQTILVGEEVTASTLAEVPEGYLKGIVSIQGSSNSHVAILARSLGIPAVMGVENLPVSQLEGQELIIDGSQGQVYVAPSKKIKKLFNNLIKQQHELTATLEDLRGLSAQTIDGHSIALWVNTGLVADAGLSLTAGAEGIGLYRTEIPFMTRERFPAEDEQLVIYQQLLKAFAPRPVVMRTLDIGGDKKLPYFPVEEDNPFLGWRGIRVTLDHPEIFLMQIRAMLRASEKLDNLRIMLPMISCVAEVDEALRLINQAFEEVLSEGHVIELPPIGVMIEIPSAVYQAHALAQRVDFLSVGSNDLTQYLLAVDRNNARVANLYQALHPAVLQALVHVVDAAHEAGKPVSICGEMAGDPVAVPLLLAMGFDALSMNSSAIPKIKWVIRNFHMQQACELLMDVLAMDNSIQIRQHLEKILREVGLEKLLSNTKS